MKFFKTIHITKKMVGCLTLGGLLLASAAFALPPAAARVSAMVTSSAERKLPIYCVQTEKPQVSVSFDAAWGAGRCRRNNFYFCTYTSYSSTNSFSAFNSFENV